MRKVLNHYIALSNYIPMLGRNQKQDFENENPQY